MRIGDAVAKVDWNGELNPHLLGIILHFYPDPTKLKNPFGAPWIYRVLWNDGVMKEHEMGTLRRVFIYEFAHSRNDRAG
jgi:hypothetical protein